MSDGLYRVVTSYLCAGFVVHDGKMVRCAPILRSGKLLRLAEKIA